MLFPIKALVATTLASLYYLGNDMYNGRRNYLRSHKDLKVGMSGLFFLVDLNLKVKQLLNTSTIISSKPYSHQIQGATMVLLEYNSYYV